MQGGEIGTKERDNQKEVKKTIIIMKGKQEAHERKEGSGREESGERKEGMKEEQERRSERRKEK